MQNIDIAIVILSCDKFKVTWKPCIDHFFRAWPECSHPVYLLNNFIPSEDARVIDLLVGEDLNWSDTLKKGLLKIENERIFFLYDDAFISKLDVAELKSIFKLTVDHNLDSVALRRRIFDSGDQFNEKLYKIKATAKYRNSLYLNLIRRDLLLKLLKSGESTWQFEKDGNQRSSSFDFYSVYSTKVATYHHGIIKGKWMPKVFQYLKSEGYALTENTFECHSKLKVTTMQVYDILFYAVHKLRNIFK